MGKNLCFDDDQLNLGYVEGRFDFASIKRINNKSEGEEELQYRTHQTGMNRAKQSLV